MSTGHHDGSLISAATNPHIRVRKLKCERRRTLRVYGHARVIGLKVMEAENAEEFRYAGANVWNRSAAVDAVENCALAVHRECSEDICTVHLRIKSLHQEIMLCFLLIFPSLSGILNAFGRPSRKRMILSFLFVCSLFPQIHRLSRFSSHPGCQL
jgi:hypothetical protein